jgi:hypothetical protein
MATPSQVIKFMILLDETNEKLQYTRMKRKHVIQPIRNAIDYFSIINAHDSDEAKQKYYFTATQLEHLREGIDKLWTYADDAIDEPREQADIDRDDERHKLNLNAMMIIDKVFKEVQKMRTPGQESIAIMLFSLGSKNI